MNNLPICPSVSDIFTGVIREGFWLQDEVALQAHRFRDAEPQPVIPPNAKKRHPISLKELRPGLNVSFKPLTTVYQAQHGILVTSVTPKAVTVYLEN